MSDDQTNDPVEIPDFVAEMKRQWIEAGIIPADGPPVALEAKTEDAYALVRKSRLNRFKELCPAEFKKKIDRELLPCSLASWDKADAWTGVYPGLWIWSPETGQAKTRMLWRQFGRYYVERGRNLLKITGQALAEEYFGYHMEGCPRGFYRWVMGFDLVMIDDIDKMDLSDKRAPRMVRELFDEFYSHNKPVLVTANEPIEHFQKRVGESMARRIREACTEIKF